MLSLIRKAMLTGVGLAVMTKDRIEELGRDMIKKGEISEKEGKEFIDEMLKKSEEAGKHFEERVEEIVHKIMAKSNVAARKDLDELAGRVELLEKGEARIDEKQE